MCLFSLSVRGRYCVQRFAAVIMRIREPKTTALIFASGKMVILGFRYVKHFSVCCALTNFIRFPVFEAVVMMHLHDMRFLV